MHRHASVSAVEVEWAFVSAQNPCTICAGQDACRRGVDDEFGCCTRVSSEWPLTAGGWVHRLELRDEPGGTRPDAAGVMNLAQ